MTTTVLARKMSSDPVRARILQQRPLTASSPVGGTRFSSSSAEPNASIISWAAPYVIHEYGPATALPSAPGGSEVRVPWQGRKVPKNPHMLSRHAVHGPGVPHALTRTMHGRSRAIRTPFLLTTGGPRTTRQAGCSVARENELRSAIGQFTRHEPAVSAQAHRGTYWKMANRFVTSFSGHTSS